MTSWQHIVLAAIAVAALLSTWLGRYELTVGGPGAVYRLDRLTGAIRFVHGRCSYEVREAKLKQPVPAAGYLDDLIPGKKPGVVFDTIEEC